MLKLADFLKLFYTVKNAKNNNLKSHKVDESLRETSGVRNNPELKYKNYFAKTVGITSEKKPF